MVSINLQDEILLFSSSFRSLRVSTDAPGVVIALADADSEADIFSETYHAHNGMAVMHDLDEIAERHLRSRQSCLCRLRITAIAPDGSADSRTVNIVYCDRNTDLSPSSVVTSQFLTSLSVRTASRQLPETLYYILPPSSVEAAQPISVSVHYRTEQSDELRLFTDEIGHTAPLADRYSPCEYRVDLAALAAHIEQREPNGTPFITAVTVDIGRRSATLLYPLHTPHSTLRFYFANMFNCVELAEMNALVTDKLKVSVSEAVCLGSLCLYDRSAEQSFEAEIGGLSPARARWFGELLTSHAVHFVDRVPNEDDFREENFPAVFITDSTADLQTGDGELCSLKFTWRYATERPSSRLALPRRIHSQQYKNQFN